MRARFVPCVFSLAILHLAVNAGWAQTAQVTGRITDTSHAVIQGASVTVTNVDKGQDRQTHSNEEGYYTVPLLEPGTYRLIAQMAGFKPLARSGITLRVNQVIRIDLELAVGEITEAINVESSSVAVDAENATVGQVITQRQVHELPLNGRNFLQLLFLGAGAVQTNGEQGSMRQGAGDAISINGARPTSNNYLLDGTANTDTALNTPAVVLSVDAIQEFKEQTATYSAEYGFSANQISIVSKTGTNDLHGSLFWFGRNDALDARNFFSAQKAPLRQNQFGFVAGGPVVLPHTYDGKNKTFWLANYEGTRIRRGIDEFRTIPTREMLAGRFTSTIRDPLNGDPFPNNVIPESRFSRLGNLARQKFFPAPNIQLPQGNYRLTRSLPTDSNQQTYRLDQQLGSLGTLFGRITAGTYTNAAAGAVLPTGDVFFHQEFLNWQFAHSTPLGRNVVNQFRFGYLDFTANQYGAPAAQSDIDALGLTGVFANLSKTQRAYPSIGFQADGLSGSGGTVNATMLSNQPMWDFSNTTSMIRGRHTLSFGANYRRWQLNRDLANNFLGVFSYSGDFSGNSVADMLLGYFQRSEVFQPAAFSNPDVAGNPRQMNFQYLGPYIQDDWKINPRLTLNLGLRWDFRAMPYETNDHFAWWDPSNPQGGLLVADRKLQEAGILGDNSFYAYAGRRTPHDASKNVWAPRFGFAFRPFGQDKIVVRGGYGIFFDSSEEREIDGSADIYPYVSRGVYVQSFGQPLPLQTTNQLFPDFAAAGPVPPAANTFLAVIQSHHKQNPYAQQWSFSVQRELSNSTTFEVNYSGNKGTHLLMRRNIAQATPYDPANPLPVLARRPYPNFAVYINSEWSGNSSYNAFNARLERRTTSLVLTSVYTWAKSLDNKSAAAGIGNDLAGWQGFLNNHDVKRDRGRSEFEVDHRLVSSFLYDLPLGRGRRYFNQRSGIASALMSGWQVNGIVTFQRGFPYSVNARDIGGLLDSFGTNRADVVADPSPNGFRPTLDKWFNTAAFSQPVVGSFGNSGRGILRAAGINNWDMAVFKNFALREPLRMQFRMESFNAFNHAQWNVPVRDVNSPQYGQITSARPGRINQLGMKLLW